jgi:hypothetical protein
MTIQELAEQHAEEKGYDGLFFSEGCCACFKGDLMACGENGSDCEFGYKHTCPHCKTDCICQSKDVRDFKCPECEEDME